MKVLRLVRERILGSDRGVQCLTAFGMAGLVYSILDDSLPDILRFKMRFMARGCAIVRFVLSVSPFRGVLGEGAPVCRARGEGRSRVAGNRPHPQAGAGSRRPPVAARRRPLTRACPIWYNMREFPF